MPRQSILLLLLCGLLLQLVCFTRADLYSHKYKESEPVIVWVNKVGPFQNPQESYAYYDLPFCQPTELVESGESLGEALQGYELVKSDIEIPFRVDTLSTQLCKKELTGKEAQAFRHAILRNYWYQLFIDDLPVWGRVGEVVDQDQGSPQVFIYTHKRFSIAYNGQRVIEVNLTTDMPVRVDEGAAVHFTYSSAWVPTDTPFDERFDKYLDETFFEHQIHWFSIFNSFMMVIFLVGLVAMILLRTLRKDFAALTARDDDDVAEMGDLADDSGWKQVRGDVFRAPPRLSLLASLLGTGMQLLWLGFCVIMLALLADFYEDRGTLTTVFIACYTLTSGIGGYYGGGFYSRYGGKHWIRTLVMTCLLLPGLFFCVVLVLSLIATAYRSLASVSLGTLTFLVTIWALVACPLTLGGTLLGRHWAGKADFPCRVNQVPRQIPDKKWYRQPWCHVLLGGVLPFGSIFIEMYFVFTSFWHYKYYYVYGFMLLVYCILIVVSVCVTIVSTYFLLNAEDYRWYWVSFLSSASTALYVFLYSIYYYYAKTKMSGFFQTSFYYGYTFLFCVGLGVLCGAVGFMGTSYFVRKIYQMKID